MLLTLPDVTLTEIASYFAPEAALVYSTAAKNLGCDRSRNIQLFACKLVAPIVAMGPEHPLVECKEDLEWFNDMTFFDCLDAIQELSDCLLEARSCHVWVRMNRAARLKPSYLVPRTVAYWGLNDEHPREFLNARICAVYRCRLVGRVRRAIKRSLQLRALVG